MGSVTRVFERIDELTEGATDRRPVHAPDGKSGAALQRLRIDGLRAT
jgi:hypothetical protein